MQLNFEQEGKPSARTKGLYRESQGSSTGVFPSGIFLGTVKSFQARPLDGQAIVEPAVDLSTVEDVFVVVGAK